MCACVRGSRQICDDAASLPQFSGPGPVPCLGCRHKDDSEIVLVHERRPVHLGRKRSQAAITVQLWRGCRMSGSSEGSPSFLRGPMEGFQDTVILELQLESGGIHQLGEGWMTEEAL